MAQQTHFVVFWIRIFTSPLPLPPRETSLTKMLLGRGLDTEPIERLEEASGIPTDDRNIASGGNK